MPDLRLPRGVPRWGAATLAGVVIAVSLGLAVAIVRVPGSPSELTARGTPLPLATTPATAPTSAPSPETTAPASAAPGAITLTSVGTNQLVATTATAASVSSEGGPWVPIPVPSGTTGLVADGADSKTLLAGGSRLQITRDAGAHWTPTPAQPSATGPFVPLLISPWDPQVLFASHQGQVAVTTDGGSTWQDVGVPSGGQPVMASGSAPGTFFVGSGSSVNELTANGAQVNDRPALPAGVTLTSLAVGRSLLVACCAAGHLVILEGTQWTPTPMAAAGPFAVDGTDIWAAVPATGANAPETVEESTDGGGTWQVRQGLPEGSGVYSLSLSSDGSTAYALISGGEVYESQKGTWYQLSTGLALASPPP